MNINKEQVNIVTFTCKIYVIHKLYKLSMQLQKKHRFIQDEVFRLHLTVLYLQMGRLDHQNAWVHYKDLNVVIKPGVNLKILTHFCS